MKYLIYLFSLLTGCSASQSAIMVIDDGEKEDTIVVEKTDTDRIEEKGSYKEEEREIRVISFEELKPYLNSEDSIIHFINFWATWCKPCVEELPAFESIREKYPEDSVYILLVSLDFPSQINEKLIPFVEENNLRSEVVLLDEADPNSWIDKVSPEWNGPIPATLVYHHSTGFREFYQKQLREEELEYLINQIYSGK